MTPAEKRKRIVNIAKKLVGKPYEYGAYLKTDGEREPVGFDCSSFTQYVFAKAGIEIPRSSILQAVGGIEIHNGVGGTDGFLYNDVTDGMCGGAPPEKINLEPGDLLFIRGNKGHYDDDFFSGEMVYIGHVALYLGGGKVIHAKFPEGVVIQRISDLKWPIIRMRRVIGKPYRFVKAKNQMK